MTGARYRHIGGAVIADHGPISLAAARNMAQFYAGQSLEHGARGALRAAQECEARSRSLSEAVGAAISWRRAAGWTDPDMADQSRARWRRRRVD
jgi:hypothetical protein